MPRLTALTLTLTLLSTLSLVTAGWIQETWSITQLTTHFMGNSSGVNDGTWPTDSGFPSTAKLILRQSFRKGPAVGGIFRESGKVEHYDVTCGTTWMPRMTGGVVVDEGDMGGQGGWIGCQSGGNGRGNGNQTEGWRFWFGGLGGGRVAGPMGFMLGIGIEG